MYACKKHPDKRASFYDSMCEWHEAEGRSVVFFLQQEHPNHYELEALLISQEVPLTPLTNVNEKEEKEERKAARLSKATNERSHDLKRTLPAISTTGMKATRQSEKFASSVQSKDGL